MCRNSTFTAGTRPDGHHGHHQPRDLGRKRELQAMHKARQTPFRRDWPAAIVIPRISGSPPSHAALMADAKKFGPQRFGQRLARTDAPPAHRLCRIVPMPRRHLSSAPPPTVTWMKSPPEFCRQNDWQHQGARHQEDVLNREQAHKAEKAAACRRHRRSARRASETLDVSWQIRWFSAALVGMALGSPVAGRHYTRSQIGVARKKSEPTMKTSSPTFTLRP